MKGLSVDDFNISINLVDTALGGAINIRTEAFNTGLERIRARNLHFLGARLGVNKSPIVY